jgi:cytochrome P450
MVLGLISAAADTLFCNLSFLLAFMAEHPDKLARAHAEIDSVVGTHRLVDMEDQEHLPYVRAIGKEIFRIKPSVPIVLRTTLEDTTLLGYHVPKGANIYVNAYAMQRDEHTYGPDAKEFKPERFLEDLSCVVGSSKEQKWVPYGGGERLCIGYRLAQAENFLLTSGILQCFEIVNPTPDVKFSDRERYGLTVCPESFQVFMKPRPVLKEAQMDANMRA